MYKDNVDAGYNLVQAHISVSQDMPDLKPDHKRTYYSNETAVQRVEKIVV